jgi:hypothetical protein
MAFYFLLRVCEYTLPPTHVTTRTIQFRVSDTRFWHGQTLLPPTSEAATLTAATSMTLVMDNQKNGIVVTPSIRRRARRIFAAFAQLRLL